MKMCCKNFADELSNNAICLEVNIGLTFADQVEFKIGRSNVKFCPFCGRKLDVEFEEESE